MPKDELMEQFREELDKATISCAVCGYKDYGITRHLRVEHKLSVDAYQKKHENAEVKSKLMLALEKRMERIVISNAEDDIPNPSDALITLSDEEIKKMVEEKLEDRFVRWHSLLPQIQEQAKEYIPGLMSTYVYDEKLVTQVGTAMVMGMNMYLEGPVGCGKTELIRQVCAKMNRPMMGINAHGDLTVNNFMGHMRVRRDGEASMEVYFMEGILLKALRMGAVLVIDEIDFMTPNISAILHSVMDERKGVYVSEIGEWIFAQPGFQIVGIGNTGGRGDFEGRYIGAETQNIAFLDRFQFRILVDYMPPEQETQLILGLAEKERTGMMKLVREVRESFKSEAISSTISTRKLLTYQSLRSAGFNVKEALDLSILNGLDNTERTTISEMVARVGL